MTSSRRIVLAAVLAVAALGILATATRLVALQRDRLVADDFTQDFVSAKAWRGGEDPYGLQREQGPRLVDTPLTVDSLRAEHRNPHAPTQFVLTAPLTALPYRAARTIWLLVTAGLFSAALYGVGRSVGLAREYAAPIAIGALAIPVVQNDLLYGQIGGPLLALLVLAWLSHRGGHDGRAGVALGVATAIKLFPAFLIVPLLRRRNFRAVVVTVIVAGVVTGASFLLVGSAATRSWLRVAAPDNFRFWRAAPVNIALPGIPFRWLTASPWHGAGPDHPAVAAAIAVGLGALCAAAAFATKASLSRDVFVSALPWMLLAGPLTGDLSLSLVLPFLFLAVAASREGGRRLLVWAGALVALIGTPPGVPGPRPDLSAVVIVLGYGLPAIALLVLALVDSAWGSAPVRASPGPGVAMVD